MHSIRLPLAMLIAACGSAHAMPWGFDLPTPADEGLRALGSVTNERLGASVTALGDVDGDGRGDFAITSVPPIGVVTPLIDVTYVVLDASEASLDGTLDLAQVDGSNGFRVEAPSTYFLGASVTHCDMDGDGLQDVVLGAPGLLNINNGVSGGAFVIYGRTPTASGTIDVSALSSAEGFRIVGDPDLPLRLEPSTGSAVACAGDIDGDGRDDLLVAAPEAYTSNPDGIGAVYVVHGRPRPDGDVSLAELEQGVIERIDGANGGESYLGTGAIIAGIGDVSGDGKPDFAFNCSPTQGTLGCIVYGQQALPARSSVASLAPPTGSYIMSGASGVTELSSIGGAGDIDDDGIGDLAIGTGRMLPTIALVTYGRDAGYGATLDLGTLDVTTGWKITDDTASMFGALVTQIDAGSDFDGDGVADLVVSTYNVDNNLIGAYAYLISPRTAHSGFETSLQSLDGATGTRFCTSEYSTGTLATTFIGDVNNDGLAEVLVGNAAHANDAGAAYIVYGTDRIFANGFETPVQTCTGT
jgi:hypothetical protein